VVVAILEFLHISKCNEITSDKTCKVKTQYDSICLKDDDQFAARTVNDKRHVRIVSMTGNENDSVLAFLLRNILYMLVLVHIIKTMTYWC
jgi:hypothetical protein